MSHCRASDRAENPDEDSGSESSTRAPDRETRVTNSRALATRQQDRRYQARALRCIADAEGSIEPHTRQKPLRGDVTGVGFKAQEGCVRLGFNNLPDAGAGESGRLAPRMSFLIWNRPTYLSLTPSVTSVKVCWISEDSDVSRNTRCCARNGQVGRMRRIAARQFWNGYVTRLHQAALYL